MSLEISLNGDNQEEKRMISLEQENQHVVDFIDNLINNKFDRKLEMEGSIPEALNRLLEKLRINSLKEMDRAVSVSIRVNETTILSAKMLNELRNVNDQVHSIATATDEMVNSVQNIRNNGEKIAKQAAETNSATKEGSNFVRLAISGMKSIKESVDNTIIRISSLESFSKDIGKIAERISLVAFQTKLLALNATIEAARAGEAGRSFAVVANEVKRLSENTSLASNDIEKLVKQLQEEMEEILKSLKENEIAVANGQNALQNVEGSIYLIEEKASNVTNSTKEIALILGEQKLASEEISNGIHSISINTDRNVNGIEGIVDSMDQAEGLISGHISDLSNIEVSGKIIKLAKSDHVIWKKRLANMMAGREGLKTNELADHHSCRLGKWYDKVENLELKKNSSFIELLEPHYKVHAHGRLAVELFNKNRIADALREIEAVEKSSIEVLNLLDSLDNKNF